MGSYFVNPGMLLGIGAISAPIIIWLLTRYRYRTVEWAALEFLLRAVKREQRRLRLENLLLLLLRCLLLALFAVVLARPRSVARVETDASDKRHNVVLLIDTSYSTGYQLGSDEEETAYQRELRVAKELISDLREGDRLLILGFDETVRELYSRPRDMGETGRREAITDLEAEELHRGARRTDLAEALHALPRVLLRFEPDGLPPQEGQKPLQKTVFILSDAQRQGLFDAGSLLVDQSLKGTAQEIEALGGSLVLVDCGAEDPVNASFTHLGTREMVVGQGLPSTIEAQVRNWSDQDIPDLTVNYFVDGAADPQKSVSLTLPAGEEVAPDPLRYVFTEPGSHRVTVQLVSDALTIDNWRHLVIDVRPSVNVLMVDGERGRDRWESETDFVRQALSLSVHVGDDGLGLMRPEVIDEAQLSGRRLDDYDVVMLANVSSLDDEAVSSLERYARNGGAVVITMGGQVDLEAWNSGVWRQGAGLLPCRLVERRGGTRAEAEADPDAPSWVITVGDREDPVAREFASEDMTTHLRLPSVFGFVVADLGAREGEQVESRTPVTVPFRLVPRQAADAVGGPPREDELGPPLLIERPFGRGRVAVFLSTMDYNWNSAVTYDGFFLPFWRTLTLDLAQQGRPQLNLPVGGRYERLLRPEEYAAQVEIEAPDGRREPLELQRTEGQELYRLSYPGEGEGGRARGSTEDPGLYAITRQRVAGASVDPPPDYFSVQIAPEEGDLARASAETLREALGVPVGEARWDRVREVLRAGSGVGGAQEYWRHALVGVLLLLVAESLLAAMFGRKRR